MSWDQYIISVKGSEDKTYVQEVAICGMVSGSEAVWAKTEGLASISVEEIKKLAGSSESLRQCGPKIAGNKYMLVRDDTENEQSFCLILSRRVEGKEISMCVGKSKTALVIAQGKPDVKGGQLVSNVFSVVKYLKDNSM